jgi:hypothetical protein
MHPSLESSQCCEWCKNTHACKSSDKKDNCCPACEFYMDCPWPWHRTDFMVEQSIGLQTV